MKCFALFVFVALAAVAMAQEQEQDQDHDRIISNLPIDNRNPDSPGTPEPEQVRRDKRGFLLSQYSAPYYYGAGYNSYGGGYNAHYSSPYTYYRSYPSYGYGYRSSYYY